jgi:ADP-dependent NAD(P)H-hydrate dehydratase / NAD(P)H-hydrate epimerase
LNVLTAAEMREVDRRTEEIGIPGPILMENAGHRVVEFLAERFSPLAAHHVLIVCGKGNNGGDGYVVARQLFTRFRPRRLDVVAVHPEDASEPRRMLEACGCRVGSDITPEMIHATLVVDAILGTGISGAARGKALEYIRVINASLPQAAVVAVDVPSGMNSDSGATAGEIVRADATVTFTAPKICHVLPPNCDLAGELRVAHIGSPARLMDNVRLHLSEPAEFRAVLGRRDRDSNKGSYGHVLIVGGDAGKAGAAEMAGIAALRMGAGLVTVASTAERFNAPELMTAQLPRSWEKLQQACERSTVLAIGPGLGMSDDAIAMARSAVEHSTLPMIVDADALNALAGYQWQSPGAPRILTPHPGEMSRLAGIGTRDVQASRIEVAREYARAHGCTVVLKGYRTIVALAGGRAWVNPTGTPALAKGGSGDVLAGMLAGMVAQFPASPEIAVIAGVYLHGLAAQKSERVWGERSLLATELLEFLPEAMRECTRVSDDV